jgi:hypothetical protein
VKKLSAIPAVLVTVVLTAAPSAAATTTDTGTVGPADEPTWVIPLVAAFAAVGFVAALLSARRPR